MRRTVAGLGLALALLVTSCTASSGGASSNGGAFGGSSAPEQTSEPIAPDGSSTVSEPASEQDRDFECGSADASTWTVHPTGEDLPARVEAGTVPGPGGPPIGAPLGGARYPTPDAFLAQSNVPDPEARRDVMVAAGYSHGTEASFGEEYEVQALTFRSAPGVADYFAARLPNLCRSGGVDELTPLSDEGGITWVDTMGAGHAEFPPGHEPDQPHLVLLRG